MQEVAVLVTITVVMDKPAAAVVVMVAAQWVGQILQTAEIEMGLRILVVVLVDTV